MGILFLILKILGILLALILLSVAAVVAVPVRYRISLKAQERVEGEAAFHWLFRAVDIRLRYGLEGLSWKCRILGIPVFRQNKLEGKGQEGRLGDAKEKGAGGAETAESCEGQKPSKEQAKKRVTASIQKQKEEIAGYQREQEKKAADAVPIRQEGLAEELQGASKNAGLPEGEGEGDWGEAGGEASEREVKPHLFQRIFRFFLKIPQRLQALRSWAARIGQKLASLKLRFHDIKTLVLEETNQKAFLHLWKELKVLLKHFAPRKASGDVEFCMGDPAQTGKILGAASLIPFWAKYQVAVTPDFMAESFYVRGSLFLKGHIRAWHFVPSFVRLIKDKNIHRLITAIRK